MQRLVTALAGVGVMLALAPPAVSPATPRPTTSKGHNATPANPQRPL